MSLFPSLERLNICTFGVSLAHNEIEVISGLQGLDSLMELDLSFNKIEKI